MGRQVNNVMEAKINEELIDAYLLRKNWTIDELLTKLKEQYGIDIGYKMFAKLLRNQGSWKLTYAMALSEFTKIKMTKLFHLVEEK